MPRLPRDAFVKEQEAIDRGAREKREARICRVRLEEKLENDLLAERFGEDESYIRRVLWKNRIKAIPRPAERCATSTDFGRRKTG